MARINKQEVCVHPIYTGIYQQHKGYDNEVNYYTAKILSNLDYYPFGVQMSERSYNSTGRRYGFNGKENDEETETMDFGARLLDGDLGVWLAIDPLAGKYSSFSVYNYAENSPLVNIDPDGNWVEKHVTRYKNGVKLSRISLRRADEKVIELTIHNAKLYNYNGRLEKAVRTPDGNIIKETITLSKELLKETAPDLQQELANSINNKTEFDQKGRKVTTSLKFDEDIEVIDNLKDAKTNGRRPDDLIILTENSSDFEPGSLGFTEPGSNFVVLDIDLTNINEIASGENLDCSWAYSHEFTHQRTGIGSKGHGLGLLKSPLNSTGEATGDQLWRMNRKGNRGTPLKLLNKLKG